MPIYIASYTGYARVNDEQRASKTITQLSDTDSHEA